MKTWLDLFWKNKRIYVRAFVNETRDTGTIRPISVYLGHIYSGKRDGDRQGQQIAGVGCFADQGVSGRV